MPDYSNGKIYTIRCRTNDKLIYVGSTIQPLYKRFSGHKLDSKREKYMNIKLYVEVNNDWSNWYIELYENYPCTCREELHKKEGEVIRLIGTLNVKIAGRDSKGYYIDNVEKLREQHNQYREENKEKIKEQSKHYYIKNIDKIKEYESNNKEHKKEYNKKYFIENADKIKEQQKQYRRENADKLKENEKDYSKQYYKQNKEKKKQYSEENKIRLKNKNDNII